MDRGLLATALVVGSVGIDLLTARPSTGTEAVAIAGIAAATAAIVAVGTAWWPWVGAGVLVGLHLAIGLRFGPLVNEPVRSAAGVAALVGALVAAGLAGWAAREFPRGFAAVAAGLGVASMVAIGLSIGGARTRPGLGDHPDILLITLDTVRRDRLSTYGGPVPMPALDALAAGGLVFDDAVSAAPQTGPSHLSLLTGRTPAGLGVVSNGTMIGDHPEILARVLAERGWRTGGFVSGFPVHARYGFDQGFDRYDSDFAAHPGLHRTWAVRLSDMLWTGMPRERRGDSTIGNALAWVDEGTGPLFLWVHLYDPHGPYSAPSPWGDVSAAPAPRESDDLPAYWPERAVGDEAYWTARYDGELAWTDHLVGALLAGLDARRPGVPRIVAVVADHGESIGEHGVVFDHGDDLYDPAMRVPWILSGPGVPAGRVGCQTSTVNVAPTLVDLAGVPETSRRDGMSLVPSFRGSCADSDAWMSTVAARTSDPPIAHGLRRPDRKCIAIEGRAVRFDLAADPGETRPLTDGCEDLLTFSASATPALPRSGDAVTQQALERLGYVQR